MSRPTKQGLDYFPMDVELDEKFELIEAKHGIAGFGIIIKLYQRIYKEGYFLNWTEETSLLFSKKISININEVNAVIKDCIRIGIFNEKLFLKYKILTSVGIQKRFFYGILRRKSVNLCKCLILIDVTPLVNVNINWVNVYKKYTKYSIVKESIVNKPEPEKPSLEKKDYINSIIQEFLSVFPNYKILIPGKESSMAGKLLAVWKKDYPDLNSDETLLSLRNFFERCRNIDDKWLRDKMSLTTMVTEYNSIINKLNRIPFDSTNMDYGKEL